jgi:hypothetical protein
MNLEHNRHAEFRQTGGQAGYDRSGEYRHSLRQDSNPRSSARYMLTCRGALPGESLYSLYAFRSLLDESENLVELCREEIQSCQDPTIWPEVIPDVSNGLSYRVY